MQGVWLLFSALLLGQGVDGFFFKSRASTSSPPSAPTVDNAAGANAKATTARIRGVPDQLLEKYSQEVFVCDNGNKAIKMSSINDGFCDCLDGTDEPGTSACTNGGFYCLNEGYKMTKLSSSRVDDTICDCCDGSDEALSVCPNTCLQQAATERAALELLVNNFKRGSAIRNELINTMLDKQRSMSEQQSKQSDILSGLDADLEKVNRDLEQRVQSIKAQSAAESIAAEATVRNLLGMTESSDTAYRVQFASALVSALDWDAEHVASHAGIVQDRSQIDSHGEEEHLGDIEGVEDSYGDDAPVASCDLVLETNNNALAPLCEWPANDHRSKFESFVMSLMKTDKPVLEAMVVLGHFKLTGSFDGAADRHHRMVLDGLTNTCPADFESLPQHCELKDTLRDAIAKWEGGDALVDSDADVQRLRNVESTLRGQRSSAQSELSSAQSTLQDIERHRDFLAFVAMKNQCFEVVDGKFSYNLCVMDSVKQKEVDGHNSVTLGTFDRFEESNSASYALKMHFTNGQYCHAFGARRAEVTVACGAENVLKSASEPSTCAYALHFESPAACTPKFALASGLQV